ncbi:MAG: M24 family metallopeptidase, partial [Pseudomonadota bacterium]
IARAITAAGGQPLDGRHGHGLGLTLTEWPSIMPGDTTELREGMVLTIEPGLEIAPGRIQVHEEVIVLRESGAELLSPRAPAVLPIL